MTTSIHGHEVIQFMHQFEGKLTRRSLRDAIEQRFSAHARFHTCSAQGLTAEQLVDFLAVKGKFVENMDGFITPMGEVCNH